MYENENTNKDNIAAANMVALIFYLIIAGVLVTVAIWSITITLLRRYHSPHANSTRHSAHRSNTSSSSFNNQGHSRSGTVTKFMLNHFPIKLYDEPKECPQELDKVKIDKTQEAIKQENKECVMKSTIVPVTNSK